MPSYYEKIDGWFDFQDIYDAAVKEFDNCTFIEVGCWLGKSTVYLGEKIKESNKNIKVIAVDTWEGTKTEPEHLNHIRNIGGSDELYKSFVRNINEAGLSNIIKPLRTNSYRASLILKYNTYYNIGLSDSDINFIFLDASHEYADILDDIVHFYRLLSNSYSIIAGHDYDTHNPASIGVIRAVQKFFTAANQPYENIRNSWLARRG